MDTSKNRRDFIKKSTVAGLGSLLLGNTQHATASVPNSGIQKETFAITMWEFSWLERRWPGAGYEDWDTALAELVERGYNAIRIDAFPHLIYNDLQKEFLINPHWDTQDWGSPAITKVRLQPHFIDFIKKCKKFNVKLGLSSWWREDKNKSFNVITTPQKLGMVWLSVLDLVKDHDLMDQILYVDLSNEWPLEVWTPYKTDLGWWDTQESARWMRESIAVLKDKYPKLPYTFSFTGEVTKETLTRGDISMLDFLEPHIWMVNGNGGEFYKEVGYQYERFTYEGYDNLALKGEKLYRQKENYWKDQLLSQIEYAAEWSKKVNKPLVTTECWGVVDYKDWPLLDWDWVKELCDLGTREAVKTGRWVGISTSNFCGPQFVGMWRDKSWHQDLTDLIRNQKTHSDFNTHKLITRI
ncbi:cellulase-like family protein [Aquimarina algicola]|uniref:Cellulase n=1 Tax=Aquimarina algicola TaxID=2589995 RepID=A0A504JK06_9FLAO|nr:cellulase-like family protein [Aquimarina algicola]TPN86841.1 cellulase [Aquimarina algicola]